MDSTTRSVFISVDDIRDNHSFFHELDNTPLAAVSPLPSFLSFLPLDLFSTRPPRFGFASAKREAKIRVPSLQKSLNDWMRSI